MKKTLLVTALFAFALNAETRYINIFNFVGDARLVALGSDGEGALDGHSFLFNPTSLPSYKNLEISYSLRPVNWRPGEGQAYSYLSGSMSIDSSEAFSLYFYRNSLGEQVSIATDAQTFYGNVEPYQHMYALSYRKEVVPSFSIGLALKIYSGSGNPFFLDLPGVDLFSRITGSAALLDFGVMMRRPVFEDDDLKRVFSVAASVSNIGSMIVYSKEFAYPVPRSLHLALTHEGNFRQETLVRISYLLTAYYRNVLNAHNADNHIFWGAGAEFGFGEVVFLRGGIRNDPFPSIFGGPGHAVFSRGAGLQIPLNKVGRLFGDSILKFDYAAVPLFDDEFKAMFTREAGINSVYTLRIDCRLSPGD